LSAVFLDGFHLLNRIAHFFLHSLWPPCHSQEKHFFLPKDFNLLTSEYRLDPFLDEKSSTVLLLLSSLLLDNAIFDFLLQLCI
jgi:hypothetical protein